MTDSSVDDGGLDRKERLFEAPIHLWELLFLCSFSAAVLTAAWVKSHKEFLSHDEMMTAILVSNQSFRQMLHTIGQGGEVNPPLFFILEWLVARFFGTGDFAMRAISGVSVAAAGWLLYFTVRPLTGPRVAALAVGLVLGLSRDVFEYLYWARYYGLFVLLAALAGFLYIRFGRSDRLKFRGYVFLLLTHSAMVYLHLFGLFFSGMLLAAQVVTDWLNRRMRWRLYACIVGAWVAFGLWLPSLLRQLEVTRGGTWTPRFKFGVFLDEPALQTPLAVVLLAITLLGLLAAVSGQRVGATREIDECVAPVSRSSLLTLALAWMVVPVGSWIASNFMQPFYMRRYSAPCAAAWVFILAFILLAVYRLAGTSPVVKRPLRPWIHDAAWVGVLAVCIVFQPLRAAMDPARPKAPFIDKDFGHSELPIVFENTMDFLPRAVYGTGRTYALLIDREAAEADPGYFTKLMERCFRCWRQFYRKVGVYYYDELPAWPNGFLAVDDDLGKTFEWLFKNKPELKARLLGTWDQGQRVYLVERVVR